MEQHPVPRQITTFEFKLIGFMTLKQFLYLVVFVPTGFVLWKIIPIPLIRELFAVISVLVGVALAFVPVNDRPLDVWARNFVNRLTSPTQYAYQKNNPPLYFLQDLYFLSDPHKIMAHVESKEKLAAYLAKTTVQDKPSESEGKQVQTLLQQPPQAQKTPIQPVVNATILTSPPVVSQEHNPFFTGIVKNNKKIPLPGILIYVKDQSDNMLRLLKTNPHGVFATYNTLPSGEYSFEMKDPKEGYFFDTMKLKVEGPSSKPLEFYSKELL